MNTIRIESGSNMRNMSLSARGLVGCFAAFGLQKGKDAESPRIGRPIFTRYGDDTALSAYIGVLSAIVSNFQRFNDTIRCIKFGQHKIVFLIREPMYLIAISRTAESVALLEQQLVYVHRQIISILTSSVNDILESSPNYDVRLLMSGAELLLYDLIVESNRYCFLIWQEERGARTESNGVAAQTPCVYVQFFSCLATQQSHSSQNWHPATESPN